MLSSVIVFLTLAVATSAQNATGSLITDPGPPPLNSTSLPGQVVPGVPDFYAPEQIGAKFTHNVILSVDGMHQASSDLEFFVKAFPKSTLASLLKNSVEFTNAMTSSPSDSFPGVMAYMTGASSRTHGVYYDVSYDKSLFPPGSNCTGPVGTVIAWDETLDLNPDAFDGGGAFNLSMLPLRKTAWGTCAQIFPNDFLRVNTIFEVARQNGLVTAYTDKHPAYQILNGPSGLGLTEGFFPEVNAAITQMQTEGYDDLHWSALNNWTMGHHFNGTAGLTTPSIYGADFQTFSVSEKAAGYNADLTPSADLIQGFQQVDSRLGQLVATMKAAGTFDSTLLIITAKHGQSPIDRSQLRKISPDDLIAATGTTVVGSSADDGALLWLADPSQAPAAQQRLLSKKTALGITDVWVGLQVIANGLGNPFLDPRTPDIVVKTVSGVIYTSPTASKVAEHGGLNFNDKAVLLFAHNPSFKATKFDGLVSTRQIAPTIIKGLGFDPLLLEGVRIEATVPLPGIFH
ncbi:type I phosphodiesterase/nucleotide pyrophosphatase precursor [Hysterangium stoloniferum]|nr:type I phosphodiesterase/nucleotide pyrophosphatase precursor [Hysterangium stoloniferum]